jgi:hypothetical protein
MSPRAPAIAAMRRRLSRRVAREGSVLGELGYSEAQIDAINP